MLTILRVVGKFCFGTIVSALNLMIFGSILNGLYEGFVNSDYGLLFWAVVFGAVWTRWMVIIAKRTLKELDEWLH